MRARSRSLAGLVAGVVALAGLVGCADANVDDPDRSYVIAGGGTTGVYYSYGQHLADALTRQLSISVTVAETAGSVDNLLRIGSQQALLGFAQSDAAADAVAGVGAFSEPLPIRAVARLYDEYVHVVVRADSDIEAITDLVGRRVSLGAENSGVAVVAARILDAAGVPAASVQNPKLGLDASMTALRQDEIDGFFWVGGLPTPGIVQLAENTPIRLLSIAADVVERVNQQHAGVYRLAEFPIGAYGRRESTLTMTVPNFLVTYADAPDELIHDALRVLFGARTDIAQHVPAAALLDRRQAIFTDPVDLHPGAAEYYTESRR